MRVLVLGGTYFLGRAFVEAAAGGHRLSLVNRGSRHCLTPGVTEYHADRHDGGALGRLAGMEFDAVVDFCAYEKGDIDFFLEQSGIRAGQYLFVSTCDVYRRNLGYQVAEDGPFETRQFPGQEGAYIAGKVALERELREAGARYGFPVTSFRPAMIYGPGNYADRESIYFQWIQKAGQILHPVDATGSFQMVYVADAARAILLALGNPRAYDRAYNLCRPERLTYESFAEVLEQVSPQPFERVEVTVDTVLERQVPLPFPLLREESQWYDGSRVEELGLRYTELSRGMGETFERYLVCCRQRA